MDPFEQWLEKKGFNADDLDDTQAASLQAMFDAEKKPKKKPAKAKPTTERVPETPVEQISEALTDTERAARDIRTIAPKGFEDVAERCILEGKTVEDARTELKKAYAERAKPVGTPETTPEGESGKDGDKKEVKMENITDEVLTRSLNG